MAEVLASERSDEVAHAPLAVAERHQPMACAPEAPVSRATFLTTLARVFFCRYNDPTGPASC